MINPNDSIGNRTRDLPICSAVPQPTATSTIFPIYIPLISVSCKVGTGSFPGGKVRPGRAADYSPPSSAAVMEE